MKTQLKFMTFFLILATALSYTACDPATGDGGGSGTGGDTAITIAAIPGVTLPATGETPVTAITETAQYTGTVTWSETPVSFAATTAYTATITLIPKTGFTLNGLTANFFTIAGATSVTHPVDSGVITAVFPVTGATPPSAITIDSMSGVTEPVYAATPITTITETVQYTGTVTWSDAPTSFAESTVYTAIITLTAKTGYTLNGVAADFFSVAGATSVSNAADSGVITAVFPATEAANTVNVAFSGLTQIGGMRIYYTTTSLDLSFDIDPTTLTVDHISVTGATKGTLTGSGTTRNLTIFDFTVANGETVSVSISNPPGFSITGTSQSTIIFRIPSIVSNCDTAGKANDVCISGNFAYVADGLSGLQIIDISNPSFPLLRGSYNTSGNSQEVLISGNYAYVADSGSGLQIIDISNPYSPTLTGNCDTTGYAKGISISGNYAYIADCQSGLQIIDISNPSSPNIVGTCETIDAANGVDVSGNYAFIADNSSGFQIIDISDPTSPILVSSFDTPWAAEDVTISGNYAYVSAVNCLLIIDISDPTNPILTYNYENLNADDVVISGNYAYVIGLLAGLKIINISNPSAPTLEAKKRISNNTWFYGFWVSGEYIYIANNESGLEIMHYLLP